MISARDVSFGYRDALVLDGVDAHVDDGDVVGLIGPNGSGKTTMLRTLYAALRPRAGSVEIDGGPVERLRPAELARRIAVVAQEGAPELPLTVVDMVLLGRAPLRSMLSSYTRADHRAAAAALSRVGARDLASRSFNTLSGGEKQRVLIARALAQEADHLLLDEPTNHLDIRYQHEILALVGELGITTVVVLHDLNLAARYCDRLVLLSRGAVVASGTPDEVLVPEIIEPVYGVHVRRLEEPDCVQLVFRPRDRNDGEDMRCA
ncbi:ABC transporter ATP-binding protein [Pseudonocardia phyllosphaerae]|uniref:ABC transporter ATP-binding protein n=1 Tax=Pseudonocardia phyllosphaerae TaxID=3390502 RepID=UPI00397827BE